MLPHGRCISTRGLWRLACRTVQPVGHARGRLDQTRTHPNGLPNTHPQRRFGHQTRTHITSRYKQYAKCSTETAQKLYDAEVWSSQYVKKGQKNKTFNMDASNSRRVNVVSERLCEDTIQRLKPSLKRHKGCDILDLNPGASLWSRALHDAVKPRSHIMMEPVSSYDAIRTEVMGQRKHTVIPKDGFIWSELEAVMAEYIDPTHHQNRVHKDEEPKKNDMLLITANMATFPKKAAYNFQSLASMVMYQVFSNMRQSRLFQQYGCVRMLVWADDDMARKIIPRTQATRRRPAFESELSCEYIHEIVGADAPESDLTRYELRDRWIDYESMATVLKKMEKKHVVTPAGRETRLMKLVQADPELQGVKLAGKYPPLTSNNFAEELEELEAAKTDGKIKSATKDSKRLSSLRNRANMKVREDQLYFEILQLHDKMLKTKSQRKYEKARLEYQERLATLAKNHQDTIMSIRDGYHLFRHHSPPVLFWDQRPYEPLVTTPSEFYPNSPCCLLDIQPKPMHPILRNHGPDTDRSGDYSTLILRNLWNKGMVPVTPDAMDSIWPGFSSMAEHCPSLADHKLGGYDIEGPWGFNVRSMTETHWVEVMRAFMRWPFRPGYLKMLGRSGSEADLDLDVEFLRNLPGVKKEGEDDEE